MRDAPFWFGLSRSIELCFCTGKTGVEEKISYYHYNTYQSKVITEPQHPTLQPNYQTSFGAVVKQTWKLHVCSGIKLSCSASVVNSLFFLVL